MIEGLIRHVFSCNWRFYTQSGISCVVAPFWGVFCGSHWGASARGVRMQPMNGVGAAWRATFRSVLLADWKGAIKIRFFPFVEGLHGV
jgi:hypothetical protein